MIIPSPWPDVEVPRTTLAEFVLEHAQERGLDAAVIDGVAGRVLSYRDLAKEVRQAAAGLQAHGVARGDVLALCAPNGLAFVIAYYAAASVGAVITPVSQLATSQEMTVQLSDAGARWMVTTPSIFQERARLSVSQAGVRKSFVFGEVDGAVPFASLRQGDCEWSRPDLSPDDLALLPYSSGTSGFPKGVMLTHYQMVSSVCGTLVPHQVSTDDVVLAVLPLSHIFGMQVTMNATLRAGATLVTLPRFHLDAFLSTVETYGVTRAELVPPIVLALAKRPEVDCYDTSSLRVITSGAAPLGADLAQACAQRLGCRVKQGYGMTEVSGACHLGPDNGRDDPRSVGVALPGVESRVVDVSTGEDVRPGEPGELLVRTSAALAGYLHNPEATAATIDVDHWVHTGDIVVVDEEGWFQVVDRAKELIKYKGYQVAPAELEDVLVTHPSVADCAVVASPDPEAGEVPKAYVVLRPGCTSDGLLDWVEDRVAPYKKVRLMEIVDEIPKSPSGKILRRVLREAGRTASTTAATEARSS